MINSHKETTKYLSDLKEFYDLALEENNKNLIQETLDLLKKISKQEELLEDQVLKNQVHNWDEL